MRPRKPRRRRPRARRPAPVLVKRAALGRPAARWAVALAVFRTELLSLARDRRALFSALVLPALLYPLVFLGQGRLQRATEQSLEAQVVHIGLDLRLAPTEVGARVRAGIERRGPAVLYEVAATELLELEDDLRAGDPRAIDEERRLVQEYLQPDGHAVLLALPHPLVPSRTILRAHYDSSVATSSEALGRVRAALQDLGEEWSAYRLEHTLGEDPAVALEAAPVDVADPQVVAGAALGRLLPLLCILVVLSGGSFAALSSFAGERESGTLETLFVQPVDPRSLVAGKLAAVSLAALLTLFGNGASVAACLAFGLGELPGGAGGALEFDLARLLAAGAVFAPTALLLAALLSLVCGKAKSFREGQHRVLPLLIAAMVPALLATQDVELDGTLGALPLAGGALALRDALRGDLALLSAVWVSGTQVGWALLAAWWLARTFRPEHALDSAAPGTTREHRAALAYGAAAVLLVYVVGGWLQARAPLPGLLVTLWVVLNAVTVACVLGARRSARTVATLSTSRPSTPASWTELLGLRMPRVPHVLGALLLAPALTGLVHVLVGWQSTWLPMPSSLQSADPAFLRSLSLPTLVFVLAVSPGICEELFFRGVLLSRLRSGLANWQALLCQAVLFGAVHASIYRFVPTASLGVVLALITLRARSVVPAILLHTAYNGCIVVGQSAGGGLDVRLFWLALPGLLLLLAAPPGERRAAYYAREAPGTAS